jgi:hypothetical protein
MKNSYNKLMLKRVEMIPVLVVAGRSLSNVTAVLEKRYRLFVIVKVRDTAVSKNLLRTKKRGKKSDR